VNDRSGEAGPCPVDQPACTRNGSRHATALPLDQACISADWICRETSGLQPVATHPSVCATSPVCVYPSVSVSLFVSVHTPQCRDAKPPGTLCPTAHRDGLYLSTVRFFCISGHKFFSRVVLNIQVSVQRFPCMSNIIIIDDLY
jgi:hypothetical protein